MTATQISPVEPAKQRGEPHYFCLVCLSHFRGDAALRHRAYNARITREQLGASRASHQLGASRDVQQQSNGAVRRLA